MYKQNNNGVDLLRKIIYYLITTISIHPIRAIRSYLFLKNSNILIGSNVKIKGLINNIQLGKFNNIYDNCIFNFGPSAEFKTGNNVIFSYNVLVVCNKKIQIGNYVQIGEYTSIRDGTHVSNAATPMMTAEDIFEDIVIGNDVWIGRGCLIMQGAVIEDGVIVAANSVVKGRLFKDHIYGGCPAKMIKPRITNLTDNQTYSES